MNVNFDIDLTLSQKEAYDMAHDPLVQYLILAWSRQSGKTTLTMLLCAEWLITKPAARIGYVCRSYMLAKKIYADLVGVMPKQLIKSANGADLTVKGKNGSTLQFYSAESGASLRGNTFDYLICDEFAFFKMEQTDGTHLWNDILSPTVKVRGRKVIIVSTTLGKDNLFYEFYLRGMTEGPEWVGWRSMKKTIYDDGLVDERQIEEIRKSIPELSFRQEYMVEFLDSSMTFFSGFENCYDPNLSYSDKGEVVMGIDFSANGEDRTVVTKINSRGEVWQTKVEGSLDERYRCIAYIVMTCKGLRECRYEDNSIGTPMGEQIKKLLDPKLRRLFVPFTTTNASKDDAVSLLAVDIADRSLSFNDMELYRELQSFRCSFSKTGRPVYGGVGRHDDRVMSLAIATTARHAKRSSESLGFVRTKDNSIG